MTADCQTKWKALQVSDLVVKLAGSFYLPTKVSLLPPGHLPSSALLPPSHRASLDSPGGSGISDMCLEHPFLTPINISTNSRWQFVYLFVYSTNVNGTACSALGTVPSVRVMIWIWSIPPTKGSCVKGMASVGGFIEMWIDYDGINFVNDLIHWWIHDWKDY
jgi:hypothetical protein